MVVTVIVFTKTDLKLIIIIDLNLVS